MTENIAIQPAAAEVQARIRASFECQGLMRHLGASLSDIGHGQVRIKLSASPGVSQQHGYVHAGATAAIADSSGGYAALTMMPADSEVLTVEYKINFLVPAAGDLEAVGWVLRSGRTLTVSTGGGVHQWLAAHDGRIRSADASSFAISVGVVAVGGTLTLAEASCAPTQFPAQRDLEIWLRNASDPSPDVRLIPH